MEAQTRLERAAFEQLTPGLSLTAADLSKSIPFVPGLIRFRLLRPEDLLVMEIETTDLDFESVTAQDDTGDDTPHLVPSGSKGGLLTAVFGYQHAAEKARFEVNNIPNPLEPGDQIPIAARAAHTSRLVFKVPKGERIAFSIDGAHRRDVTAGNGSGACRDATRGDRDRVIPIGAALIELAGGLGLAQQDGQLFLQDIALTKSASRLLAAAATRSGRKQAVTTNSLIAAAQSMHDMRSRASQTSIVDARGKTGHKLTASDSRIGLVPAKLPPGIRIWGNQAEQTDRWRDRDRSTYRLFISPSVLNGWTHARRPARRAGDAMRIELWHSRLGVRSVAANGDVSIDERSQPQKIVRAIWARDLEAEPVPTASSNNDPFRHSLDGLARVNLVRQSCDVHEAYRQAGTRDRPRACALLQWRVARPSRSMGHRTLHKQVEFSRFVLGSSGHYGT